MLGFIIGFIVGATVGVFCICLIMAGREEEDDDRRRICINCEHYRPFKGVYECWNRDSDMMYKPTLPDDDCPEFERKEAQDEKR